MSEVMEDIDVEEDEGPCGPLPFDQLDERTKDEAHARWLQYGIDWDCPLKEGYGEREYFSEVLAERGMEVTEWDWSIGSYNGSDYVTFKGPVDLPVWVAWRLERYEHQQWAPWPRPILGVRCWGKVETQYLPRPDGPPVWLLALETILLSDPDAISARITTTSHYQSSSMDVDWDWELNGVEEDEPTHTGTLAGATFIALMDIVNGQDSTFAKDLLRDAEEVADEACGSLQADYEWECSMECFAEIAAANEYLFDEDGHIV